MAKQDVIAGTMPQGGIICFAPSLCITPEEVDQVVLVAKDAVEKGIG